MKRLLRILLNAGTLLSALLWVATAVLWVRGFWFDQHLTVNASAPDARRRVQLWSYRNGLSIGYLQWDNSPDFDRLPQYARSVTWESRPGSVAGWESGFSLSPGELRWASARFAWIRTDSARRSLVGLRVPGMVPDVAVRPPARHRAPAVASAVPPPRSWILPEMRV